MEEYKNISEVYDFVVIGDNYSELDYWINKKQNGYSICYIELGKKIKKTLLKLNLNLNFCSKGKCFYSFLEAELKSDFFKNHSELKNLLAGKKIKLNFDIDSINKLIEEKEIKVIFEPDSYTLIESQNGTKGIEYQIGETINTVFGKNLIKL